MAEEQNNWNIVRFVSLKERNGVQGGFVEWESTWVPFEEVNNGLDQMLADFHERDIAICREEVIAQHLRGKDRSSGSRRHGRSVHGGQVTIHHHFDYPTPDDAAPQQAMEEEDSPTAGEVQDVSPEERQESSEDIFFRILGVSREGLCPPVRQGAHQWTCPFPCGKTYRRKASCEEHIHRDHFGLNRFTCECGWATQRAHRFCIHTNRCVRHAEEQ